MKVLHIGKYFSPFLGGIENFMLELLTQQSKSNNITAIVHHHETEKKVLIESQSNIKVIRVPINGIVAYSPIAPLFGYYLNQQLNNDPPDILNIHMPNLSAFWCLVLISARKIPWVVHWHSDVIGSSPDLKIKLLYPFYRIFERLVLKKAKKIIVASPSYAKTSKPLKDFIKKVEVIPLGLSDKLIKSPPSVKVSESLKLLMIGRLTYYKGHGVLLKAIAKLQQDIKLIIVGVGELEKQIKEDIKSLDLVHKVELLGQVSASQLEKELGNCDLLCLPSIERTEAFGVVLLEAMRAGKPCLVTDVPGSGMSWVVQDGVTGFIVKHNDVDSLAEKLGAIAENKPILTELGVNGRKRFKDVFSIKSVSQKISRLYEDTF